MIFYLIEILLSFTVSTGGLLLLMTVYKFYHPVVTKPQIIEQSKSTPNEPSPENLEIEELSIETKRLPIINDTPYLLRNQDSPEPKRRNYSQSETKNTPKLLDITDDTVSLRINTSGKPKRRQRENL